MIQPVIACIPHQRQQVARLVKHCLELDGTELKVIPVSDEGFATPYKHNSFACKQAHALRTVALAMKSQPFINLEPDSPPIKPGWVKALTKAYQASGKPFLMAQAPESKYDMASGIGVFSPETFWLVPQDFNEHGYDFWMLKHLRPLIAFTPLIQHSYGVYNGTGKADPHRFPRDASHATQGSGCFSS